MKNACKDCHKAIGPRKQYCEECAKRRNAESHKKYFKRYYEKHKEKMLNERKKPKADQ